MALRNPPSADLSASSEINAPAGLVVIAASAGGIEALRQVLATLPPDLSFAVAIVQHRGPTNGMLAKLLQLHSIIRVKDPTEDEPIERGTVYVAPSDRHLLIGDNFQIEFSDSPRVCFSRPAADVLFKSAASQFKAKVIAVVLTGFNNDGAAGSTFVKAAGGTVIVQEPHSAFAPHMPLAAIETGDVDFVLGLSEIGPKIVELIEHSNTRDAALQSD